MAAPSYIGNGGIAASDNSATVAVPFPSLQANDILLLQLLSAENDTHQQPTGFTSIGTINQSTQQTSSWWWKRAAGTESGNLTCSRSNSGDAFFGIMSCWRGAVTSGTPFNSAGPTSADSNSPSSSTITPTYDYATVICLVNEENNIAIGTISGFTEAFDVASGTGDDAEFSANYIQQTTKAQVSAATGSISPGQSWATITLALWSIASSPITVNATHDTATVTKHNPTVQAANPTTISATKATVTVTKHNATMQANVDTTILIGEGGSGKNLCENPSLESGITGWTSAYSATLSQSSTQAWHGTYSLRVASGSNWSGAKSPNIPTTESTQYTLSFYIYPVDGSMPFYLDLRDQSNNLFDDMTVGTKTAGAWSRVTKTFTTSAGDTATAFNIRKDDYAGSDYFYIDGVQLELGGSATDWEDYGSTGGPDVITAAPHDVTVNIGTKVNASTGTITVTGHDATVAAEEPTVIQCTNGVVTVVGYDPTVNAKVVIPSTLETATAASHATAINSQTKIGAGTGAATATGHNPVVNEASVVSVGAASISLTPHNATVVTSADLTVSATAAAITVTGHDGVVQANVDTTIEVGGGAAGKNLWPNADLESGVDDWNENYASTISHSSAQAWHGTYSLCVTPSAAYATAFSDHKTVAGATQYTLSFYIYPANGSLTYTSTVYDQSDNWHGNEVSTYSADQWSRVDITLTTTAGDTAVWLEVSQGNSGQTDPWYIDGVQIEAGASATAWEDYSAGGGPAAATATAHDAIIGVGTKVNTTTGAVTVTGHNPTVEAATDTTVSCSTAAVTCSGHNATILGIPTVISATKPSITCTAHDASVGGLVYYVRADGTAANKAAATSDAAASTSMSVATHNSQTFTAGDHIVISDAGGVYHAELEVPSSGASGSVITYSASGSPLFDGAKELTSATYKWTASGSGTNEYYCELAAGGNPSLVEPTSLWLNTSTWGIEGSALGSLADHEWKWGNNDSLGYNTVYVRDDTGDPDTSGLTVHAPQWAPFLCNGKSYVTVNGLTVLYANGDWIAGIRVLGGSHITIENCTVKYSGNGIALEGTDYGVVDGCVADLNITHGINVHGEDSDTVTNCEVKNSTSSNTIQTVTTPGIENGYGIKFMFITNSSIHNCEVYGNDFNGIDLDGGDISAATYCDVYENRVYENGSDGILVEIGSSNNKLYRNIIYNNAETQDGAAQIRLWDKAQNNEIYGNVIYLTNGDAAGTRMIWIGSWDDARSSSGTKIYNNTIDGGGISTQGIYLAGNATPSNTLVKNNIVANMVSGAYFITGSDFTGMTFDYNCIEASGNLIFYNAGWASWSTWQGLGQDAHSYNTDPLFKDAANGKFYLTSSSPCIDTGVDLGATYDDGIDPHMLAPGWPDVVTLDQDSWGSGWEIGAYVYDYVDTGTITVTPHAASILTGSQTVSVTSEAVTVTGHDVGIAADLVIPVTSDAVTVTGHNPSVVEGSSIPITSETITVTALAATISADETIAASSDTATLAAHAATVEADVDVSIPTTAAAATGTAHNATINVGTKVLATVDAATITGYDVSLAADNNITATLETATVTAHDAVVALGSFISADVAAATITAHNPTITAALAISATHATATATSHDAVLGVETDIPITLGAVTVTSHAGAVSAKTTIAATVANVVVAALDASISGAVVVPITKASVTVTGHNPSLGENVVITATLGTAAITALDALLSADTNQAVTKATVTITGTNPLVLLPIDVTVTKATATATASNAAINVETEVDSEIAAGTVTSHNPTVYAPLGIYPSTAAATVTPHNPTVFEGIVSIRLGTITVTAHVPSVLLGIQFLIDPSIVSTSIDYTIDSATHQYTITSTGIDYEIEELA